MRRSNERPFLLAALLSLSAACGGGSSGGATVTVTPASPAVVVGASQQFTATVTGASDTSVTWSIQQGSAGGSISATGLYTPAAPGAFQIVATSVADPSRSGSTTAFVNGCVLPLPQPVAPAAGQVLELGGHAVGEVVSFAVPAGTGSVTLLQQGTETRGAPAVTIKGTSYPNTVIPAVISVNGTQFYNQNTQPPDDPSGWGTPGGIGSMYFESLAPWTGTVTVPNTTNALSYVDSHGGVPSGTWSVQVFDYAAGCSKPSCIIGDGKSTYPPGRYDIKVLLKPGAVAATGTIDVNVYLVTDKFTKATAETDPSMARMGATLGSLLGGAGLTLGTLTFVDVPASVKLQYTGGVNIDDGEACGEVAQILGLAGPGNAMNLFLVNSLFSSQDGGFTTVGLDGTIPGPAAVGGTVASGALVSVVDLRGGGTAACNGALNLTTCGADRTAYVSAHETGHALGLYHDTESTGTTFDPVTDTPTCACKTCAPPSQVANCFAGTQTSSTYQMVNADCTKSSTCGGGENLMFWLLRGGQSTGALSPQQARIMRANPYVQ